MERLKTPYIVPWHPWPGRCPSARMLHASAQTCSRPRGRGSFTPGNFKKDATVRPSHGRLAAIVRSSVRPSVRPSVRKRPRDNPAYHMVNSLLKSSTSMLPAATEKRRTPLSPPPPPYGEAMSSKSNENEDWQGFFSYGMGCRMSKLSPHSSGKYSSSNTSG
jgi:hypothetical protein